MAYDANAKAVATKALGTVESSMNYASVNYNDPITVGLMQWYGTRAAAILGRMRTENPSAWVGVPASLTGDMDSHPAGNAWWNDRYLTKAEGEALKPVLNNNKAIQNDQNVQDLEAYKDAAVRAGIDPEGNTQMMLLYFVARHQTPARANRVIASIGPSSNIERLLAAILNEEVFKRYPSRYKTAYNIIKANDSSGVGDIPGPTPEPEEPGGENPGTGVVRAKGDVKSVRLIRDAIHIQLANGATIVCLATSGDLYIPSQDASTGATVPDPEPNPDPETPPTGGGGTDATRAALVQFVVDRTMKYDYSQGPTRMEPDKNNYTDCSGLTAFAYRSVAGIDIGYYTGAQLGKGTLVLQGKGNIDESQLLLGDLILYNWRGGRDTVDHVEMYKGNSQVIGHGGPGKGPFVKTLQGMANNALNWYVRRYV